MSSEARNDTVWRLIHGAPIPYRYWDGDYVVYNPVSGSTHILDIAAGEVLRVLMSGPLSGLELCQHMSGFLEVPDDEALAERIEAIVGELDRLGLIEPVPAC